jgi:hypothetical protein
MEYKEIYPTSIQEGVWNEKTCIRRTAGFDIDKTNLPADMKYLPKGAVLALDSTGLKVVLVKSAKATAQAASGATSLKVAKGHALVVGDVIAGSTISKIAVGTEFDTLTVSALSGEVAAGAVVADANGEKAIGLNYATVKLDSNPSCTPTIQAYEIEEDTLPYPVNEEIKTALTSRHDWRIG